MYDGSVTISGTVGNNTAAAIKGGAGDIPGSQIYISYYDENYNHHESNFNNFPKTGEPKPWVWTVWDEDEGEEDVDFSSYPNDAAIWFRNETPLRLIAFRSSLHEDNKIGGIPAMAANHAVQRNTALFNVTSDFPVYLITEKQYNDNKNNLSSLGNQCFGILYAFWNPEGSNETRYIISDRMGGGNKLRVINNTAMNVELRLGNIDGPALGYAQRHTPETILSVTPGDLYIYPVFKSFNPFRGTIDVVFPKSAGAPLGFVPGTTETEYVFEFDVSALGEIPDLSPSIGAAWLVINNNTTSGVSLIEGSTIVRTSAGVSVVNSQQQRTFQFDMNKTYYNQQYSDSRTFNGEVFRIQSGVMQVYITDAEGNTEFDLETDKMYVINVTGNSNDPYTFKAVIDMDNATDIEFDGYSIKSFF